MKNLIKYLACIFIMTAAPSGYTETLHLEHEFDGYYAPMNMPVFTWDNDEAPYFYSPVISSESNVLSLTTYNEDYSLRDSYTVSYDIPPGYEPSQIMFSSSLRFDDGTPFFIVTFRSTDYKLYNTVGYSKAQVINAETGAKIYDFPDAASWISGSAWVYLINGRPSILMTFMNGSDYVTRVYSLGEARNDVPQESVAAKCSADPIRIFDLSGRQISAPLEGHPFIEQFSDGSASVKF